MNAEPPSNRCTDGGSSDTTKSAAPTPRPFTTTYLTQMMMFDEECQGLMFDENSDDELAGIYRCLFEDAPDATVIFDESNRVLVRNRAAREFSAAVFERLLAVDAPWATEVGTFWKEVARAGRSELEVSIDDRAIVLRGRAHGLLHVVTLSDVTELRRIEAELRAFERIESVGLMTASLVHDLNNLLMPIATTSALLLRELEQGSDAMAMVREVQSATDRAVSLTRQILGIARRQPARVDEVSLSSVVLELQPLVRRVAGPAVRVDLVLAPTMAVAKLDRERLERVILNLVANARDAMPSGGRITLSTAEIGLNEQEAGAIPGATKGAYVALRVSDTGTGISSEIRERMFAGFFSTKEEDRGTGLGLATIHRFVTNSRGCISVHSQPDQGTTVSLYFPVASAT